MLCFFMIPFRKLRPHESLLKTVKKVTIIFNLYVTEQNPCISSSICCIYSYAPYNNISVKDRVHIYLWSHKVRLYDLLTS